jgi:acetyl-CoA C-acetyltransferase
MVPVEVPQKERAPITVDTDEYPRFATTMEKLAKLRPALSQAGTVTAGNSSGINDGAAALLVMSEEKAVKMGIRPPARIVAYGCR